MKLSVLIAACNAGPMLLETLKSVDESCDGADYETIVVNDCSTDGCCNEIPSHVKLINVGYRRGCSGSRHLAGKHATGDVLIISDPHCYYPKGALPKLAEEALKNKSIIQPPIYLEGHRRKKAATIRIGPRGLTTKVISYMPEKPIMIGSIYGFSRETWEKTGSYPVLPGWWDVDENYISSIAYRVGLGVRTVDVPKCVHRWYRNKGRLPFSLPMWHTDLNAHWFHAVCFPRYYEKMFKGMLDNATGYDTSKEFETEEFLRAREFIERNSVRTEFWFMRNVVTNG